MTARWREVVACDRCGFPISTEPPIKAWIRAHEHLDSRRACLCIGDSDLWVQKYGTRLTRRGVDREVQYLMLLEIKTHGRDLDPAQRDLLSTVNSLLRTKSLSDPRIGGMFIAGHAQTARSVFSRIAGRWVQVQCYGVHVLRLSGATPEDSTKIMWDKRTITRQQLVGLLRFDLSPDTLREIEHRQHKARISAPTLPGLGS